MDSSVMSKPFACNCSSMSRNPATSGGVSESMARICCDERTPMGRIDLCGGSGMCARTIGAQGRGVKAGYGPIILS